MSASDRQRRLRARQRRGEVVAPLLVSGPVIETLMDLGWLLETESEDRDQIGEAASRMLAELAASHTKKP